MSLVCCIITYNDFPLIVDCIESIQNRVDRIVVIDGRYIDFPGVESVDYSLDGTLEYLKSIPKVELMFWKGDEISKRNFYLMQVNDGDIVLNLDADEVLIGDIPELKADWGIVSLQDGHGKHIQHRASRFFKYKDGIHYMNTHCTLYDKNDKIINKLQQVINPSVSFELVTTCHILHNWHLRSPERQYNKTLYYRKLVRNEAGQIK